MIQNEYYETRILKNDKCVQIVFEINKCGAAIPSQDSLRRRDSQGDSPPSASLAVAGYGEESVICILALTTEPDRYTYST